MIVKWLLDAVVSFVDWLIGWFPAPTLPPWITGAPAQISSLMGNLDGFGLWMPLTITAAAIVLLGTSFGMGLLIKLGRIIASFFTAGGGSAA